jgi:hypothetical protein
LGILSVVESSRRIGAPVKEYLAGVLPGLDSRKLSQGCHSDAGTLVCRTRLMSTWIHQTLTIERTWRHRTCRAQSVNSHHRQAGHRVPRAVYGIF